MAEGMLGWQDTQQEGANPDQTTCGQTCLGLTTTNDQCCANQREAHGQHKRRSSEQRTERIVQWPRDATLSRQKDEHRQECGRQQGNHGQAISLFALLLSQRGGEGADG
jgi:hypothetical protein